MATGLRLYPRRVYATLRCAGCNTRVPRDEIARINTRPPGYSRTSRRWIKRCSACRRILRYRDPEAFEDDTDD